LSTELTMLAWTIVLGFVQIIAAAQFSTAQNGLQYNISPRDTPPRPLTGIGGRVDRAAKNLLETFPFAAAAILIAAAANRHNGLTAAGAQLYFWARLLYVPLYVFGVPVVRSLVWLASVIGIFLVLAGLVWA
jgi:uncharacterized MAPEG superfamily protein